MKRLPRTRIEHDTAASKRGAVILSTLHEAVAHHQAGRTAAAKRLYDKILATQPRQPDALNLSGVLALEQGRVDLAIRLISKALSESPNNADAHSNLGNALRAAGRSAEASSHYGQAVAIRPLFAAAHCNLGVVSLEAGEPKKAIECFAAALAIDTSLQEASRGLANAHRAVARDLAQDGAFEAAAESLRRALDFNERDATCWNALGRLLRTLGNIAEAKVCFERAIELEPSLVDARRNLALFGGRQQSAERIAELRAIIAAEQRKEELALASYALGKLLDDEGRYDDAFMSFQLANRLTAEIHHAEGRRFEIANLRAFVDRTVAGPMPNRGAFTSPSERPVFIVGMARSGTSLVEQIAASHSRVHGAGELRALSRMADVLATGDDSAIKRAVDAHLAELERLGGGGARVIDKMPDNIFHLDSAAALFAGARLIICERDARDVSLSCYFQLFTAGNEFSYDLEACGRRHVQTLRVAEHWRRHLGPQILTVRYEHLVADLETESRKLIEFLGLDWEPACLDFHSTRRVVATASGWQVRQPLYDQSVGRWRNYRSHIAGLEAAIADEAARFNAA